MTKKNKEQRIYESLKNGSVLTVCYQNEECKTAEAVGVITQVTDEYIIVKQTYENQSWLTLIWQKPFTRLDNKLWPGNKSYLART